MSAKINSEEAPKYEARKVAKPQDLDKAVKTALKLLEQEWKRKHPEGQDAFTSQEIAKAYCSIKIMLEEREHFHCLFLDNQHTLIEDARMFSGTIDGASVYPREVVKRALQVNAAAVIFAHNHPSGIAEPSESDKKITDKLKDALKLLDIRVLDHIIVGGMQTFSFAEHGLI